MIKEFCNQIGQEPILVNNLNVYLIHVKKTLSLP